MTTFCPMDECDHSAIRVNLHESLLLKMLKFSIFFFQMIFLAERAGRIFLEYPLDYPSFFSFFFFFSTPPPK